MQRILSLVSSTMVALFLLYAPCMEAAENMEKIIALQQAQIASLNRQLMEIKNQPKPVNVSSFKTFGAMPASTFSLPQTTDLDLAKESSRFYLVSVNFATNTRNANGTNIQPHIVVSVRDGASVIHEWNFRWGVAKDYNQPSTLHAAGVFPAPSAGKYTIEIRDAQSDGAHAIYSNGYLSASVASLPF